MINRKAAKSRVYCMECIRTVWQYWRRRSRETVGDN